MFESLVNRFIPLRVESRAVGNSYIASQDERIGKTLKIPKSAALAELQNPTLSYLPITCDLTLLYEDG